MERVSARRPLPALIFLLGLSLLTALVWWRVIHRSDSGHPVATTPTCQSSTSNVVPQPAAVNVEVLNSTERAHLARTVATQMRGLGFHVVGYDNDPSGAVNGVAEIRYGSQSAQGATLLSFYLPGSTLVPTQQSDTKIVVSLGTKFTKVASTTQAKKTMASQHVTQLPAKPGHLAVTPTPSPTTSC